MRNDKRLSTATCVRLCLQSLHGDESSAALAVAAYIVPDKPMQYPVLLGRDTWMIFKTRGYRTLPHTREGRLLAEFTLTSAFAVGTPIFEKGHIVVDTDARLHLITATMPLTSVTVHISSRPR